MKLDDAPFGTLTALSDREATGEFISASSVAEVHVYLQRGRIAWATDSEHPFAFTRYLQTSAGIDSEGFRDILESCKRERRPLGETLVAWGLVTRDEIRGALRHQLELALVALRNGGAAQTLFLDRTRQFAQYDEALTFGLDELLVAPEASNSPPPSSRRTSRSLPPGDRTAPPSARRLFDAGADILWTQLIDGTACVESEPEPVAGPRFAPELLERTVLDGADMAIVWLPDGLLAGVALTRPHSLWCCLAPDSTVGAAASALGAFTPAGRFPSEPTTPIPHGAPWVLGEQDGDPSLHEMRAFLDRAPEVLAALLRDASGRVCGVGRAPLTEDVAVDLVRRRARVLAIEQMFQDGLARNADANGVGFNFRSIATAEGRLWCFGAELTTQPGGTVWLLLDRRCSQGLGWAYLTSLGRSLLRVRTGAGGHHG